MTSARSRSELLVLQAVRMAGVANTEAVLGRALLPDDEVDSVLAAGNVEGVVEPFTFGQTSGWIITEAGQARLAWLLRDEASERGAIEMLERTLDDFDPLNERFVGLVGRWQLESTSSTTTGFGAADAAQVEELLTALVAVGRELRATLEDLIRLLPRFGRYPAQFTTAVERARHEGMRWVTGVGLLSCHVVWAELHQDLLSSLGRDRLDASRTQ